MYLLRLVIASTVTFTLVALGAVPVLGQAPEPAQASTGNPDKVIVPTPEKPKGSLKPPVVRLPDSGGDPTPVRRDQRLEVLIPAGTGFPARVTESLSSKTSRAGDRFEALLDQDLTADGEVVVPRGSLLVGVVEEALEGGRVKGRASLTVALEELRIGDERLPVRTNQVTIEAGSSKKKDAKTVGVATGIGALLGAVLGGKSGAAVGATIGGGAGGGRVLTSRGKPAVIEKEQLLTFRLEEDTTIRVDSGRSIDP